LKAWLNAHGTSFRTALRRFARHPFGSLFEVAVFGIALALPLVLYVGVDNLRAFAARQPAEPEISVFLDTDASPADIESIRTRLAGLEGLERVTFIPKEDAARAMRQTPAVAEVLEALPANPLPDAFTVRLGNGQVDRLEQARREIGGWPRVALAQVDSNWARRLQAAIRVAQAAVLIIAVLLASAVVAITFNTVRLQMLDRREEIELSRLIGATHGFIRRPFVYFGALQGFLGGGVALGIVAVGSILLNQPLAELSDAYGARMRIEPLAGEIGLALLGVSAVLGWGAAWLAASRWLWAQDLR
jgi:cell division transport system permease protein